MVHDTEPPSSPTLPPLEQDRLYLKLAKGGRHASQMVPNYKEFRLGHGDPLMKAEIEHTIAIASPRSRKKIIQHLKDDGEIHLIQRNLSPIAGVTGMNDIVHIDKNNVMSIPCLPFEAEDRNESEGVPKPKPTAALHAKDHLSDHGSPLAGLGMSDIVHLPDGEVLNVPILPLDEPKPTTALHPKDYLSDHGSPLAGLGMSDIVHLPDGEVLNAPILPDCEKKET